MFKSCSRCGKIHDTNYKCNHNRISRTKYNTGKEYELRNTHAWHSKSETIKEKSNYLCEVCKAKGIYTYNGLEVHHITKLKEDSSLLLDNYNLICLCITHHKQADKGLIDKAYLQKLAREREDN